MPKHVWDYTEDTICAKCGRCQNPKCPSTVCHEWPEKCAEEDGVYNGDWPSVCKTAPPT